MFIRTSLTPPLFIEVPVSSQESERSCICVLGIPNVSLFMLLLVDIGTVPIVWSFTSRYRNCSDSMVFY
jgi:hypothetical protein